MVASVALPMLRIFRGILLCYSSPETVMSPSSTSASRLPVCRIPGFIYKVGGCDGVQGQGRLLVIGSTLPFSRAAEVVVSRYLNITALRVKVIHKFGLKL